MEHFQISNLAYVFFQELDLDGDGKLNKKEFEKSLAKKK